jgi:hypothetical protein
MATNQPKAAPKFIGAKDGAKTLSAALKNSQAIVDQAKAK